MTQQCVVPREYWKELNYVLRDPLFRHTPVTRKIVQLITEEVIVCGI